MIDDESGAPQTEASGSSAASLRKADRETRERRLKIRCWRRGTKEMDLILGVFFDREGAQLDDAALAAFEALIDEDDDALYRWITGVEVPPERHRATIERLRGAAGRSPAPSESI